MSKRLQVLLPEGDFSEFQRLAKSEGLTLGAWVRRALKKAAAGLPSKKPDSKIQALRKAAKSEFPSGDIDEILGQIESGYTS